MSFYERGDIITGGVFGLPENIIDYCKSIHFPYRTHKYKVLYSTSYRGLEFSADFRNTLKELLPDSIFDYCVDNICRDDPRVVKAAIDFGLDKAAHENTRITVKEIPAYYTYTIQEYDGIEWIEPEFPWKHYAIALHMNKQDDPLLMAVQRGDVVVPDIAE